MVNPVFNSAADGGAGDGKAAAATPFNAVFINTNLNTNLAMVVSNSDTVFDLKKKIIFEHPGCFPDLGEIKIHALKVKRKGCFYHLSESMPVRSAFHGVRKNWFLWLDASDAIKRGEPCSAGADVSVERCKLLLEGPSRSVGSDSLLPQLKRLQQVGQSISQTSQSSQDNVNSASNNVVMEAGCTKDSSLKLASLSSNAGLDPDLNSHSVVLDTKADLSPLSLCEDAKVQKTHAECMKVFDDCIGGEPPSRSVGSLPTAKRKRVSSVDVHLSKKISSDGKKKRSSAKSPLVGVHTVPSAKGSVKEKDLMDNVRLHDRNLPVEDDAITIPCETLKRTRVDEPCRMLIEEKQIDLMKEGLGDTVSSSPRGVDMNKCITANLEVTPVAFQPKNASGRKVVKSSKRRVIASEVDFPAPSGKEPRSPDKYVMPSGRTNCFPEKEVSEDNEAVHTERCVPLACANAEKPVQGAGMKESDAANSKNRSGASEPTSISRRKLVKSPKKHQVARAKELPMTAGNIQEGEVLQCEPLALVETDMIVNGVAISSSPNDASSKRTNSRGKKSAAINSETGSKMRQPHRDSELIVHSPDHQMLSRARAVFLVTERGQAQRNYTTTTRGDAAEGNFMKKPSKAVAGEHGVNEAVLNETNKSQGNAEVMDTNLRSKRKTFVKNVAAGSDNHDIITKDPILSNDKERTMLTPETPKLARARNKRLATDSTMEVPYQDTQDESARAGTNGENIFSDSTTSDSDRINFRDYFIPSHRCKVASTDAAAKKHRVRVTGEIH